jgi:hypothetical protein
VGGLVRVARRDRTYDNATVRGGGAYPERRDGVVDGEIDGRRIETPQPSAGPDRRSAQTA